MKHILLIALFLCSAGFVSGQCVDDANSLCVPRATVDASARVARELVEARDVIAKMTKTNELSLAERDAAAQLVAQLNNVIAVQDKLDAAYASMMNLYTKVIDMQAALIDRLSIQLNKRPSAWDKFVSALKTVANIAIGVAIGRGL